MKKIISLLTALCLALLLAVPAFADGRGPTFTSYDVVCKKETPYYRENWENDEGVMEKDGTFPAGTKLTVDYEYELDGVLYGNVRIGDDEDPDWVYIRLSDVELKNDVYLPENDQKLAEPRTVRVIAKGGVPMYAGPNKQYDVVTNIPRGTKLTYEYSNDKYDYYRTWAYVTYFGKSGWIYVYQNDTKNGLAQLPPADEKVEIWVLADGVKMYDGVSFGNIEDELSDDWGEEFLKDNHEEPDRVVGTLEKGKKYTCRYLHGSDFGNWYNVTAGLRSGWVFQSYDTYKVAATADKNEENQYMAFRPFQLKLRETPDKKSAGTTVSIAAGDVLDPEYETRTEDGPAYYTTVSGQSGWYSYSDLENNAAGKMHIDEEMDEGWTNDNEQPAPIYSDIMQRSQTVGSIPAGTAFTPLYHGGYSTQIDEENSEYTFFYYVDYNGTKGWVVGEDLYAPDEEVPQEDERDDSLDDEVWEGDGYWDEWEETTDLPEEGVPVDDMFEEETEIPAADAAYVPRSSMSPLQIVLICVGGAAVLALTAVVTLVLIRRKRKAKEIPDAPAEETKEYPSDDCPDTDA